MKKKMWFQSMVQKFTPSRTKKTWLKKEVMDWCHRVSVVSKSTTNLLTKIYKHNIVLSPVTKIYHKFLQVFKDNISITTFPNYDIPNLQHFSISFAHEYWG